MFFFVSLFLGAAMSVCLPSFGKFIAGVVHAIAVIIQVACFVGLWAIENWNTTNTILGMVCTMFIQRALLSILMNSFLTREFGEDETNVAWWTGKWIGKGMGFWAVTLTMREWLCKIIECSIFTADVLIGHLIFFFLSIFTLIPWIDRWHSAMLFWLRPSKQIRPPIYSLKQRKQRRRASIIYAILFVTLFAVFLAIIIIPQVIKIDVANKIPKNIRDMLDGKF
ncbi:1,3-beta-D-glucan synthase [Spiromyces aspiralis]|uniref:1,3-beta-D-glucan synthase n=1 Tax=Spiromyces aspiralis TaxID=68401 RepID=A0ACC1HHR0_9FUNG|nr:1,3-beta-D-glucan synthase [Spiromyces aspiralis]